MNTTSTMADGARRLGDLQHISTVRSSHLISALTDVNAFGPNPFSNRNPALHGVRVAATGRGLELAGTDGTVWSRAVVEPKRAPDVPSVVVVGARVLAGIARQIGPGHDITLGLLPGRERDYLRVSGDGVTYQLRVQDIADFPQLPDDSDGEYIATLPSADVQDLARAVESASRDVTLPILTGVLLTERQGSLTATATDRYRASDVNTLHPVPAGFRALVRGDVVRRAAFLARRDGDLTITRHTKTANQTLIDDGDITFTVGARSYRAACITGEYPKLDTLWPTDSTSTAVFDRGGLVKAIRRVAEVAERNTPVRLEFLRDRVVMDAGTPGDADATTTIDIEFAGDVGLRVAFNPQFFLDGIAAVPGDRVRMSFTQATRPAVITGSSSAHVRYLLMPVRLA